MKKYQTDQEMLYSLEQSFFLVENDFQAQKLTIEEISQLIPGYIHLNNKKTAALEYANQNMCTYFDLTQTDIQKNNVEATKKLYCEDDLQNLVELFHHLPHQNEFGGTSSLFIRMRRAQEHNLYFTSFKLYRSQQCLGITFPMHDFSHVANSVSNILAEKTFFKKNFQKFSLLTKREKEVLTLLAEGYNNPSIADLLFISRRTVENHRKNLNKKLELKNFAHLMKYAYAFQLLKESC